ncbi:MAG TPA: hypothetical protein VGQ89_03150 [Candidatus Limnocylindrales bacterium]|jgi:hypothetical protein|nr:hypothetical protein [Candidatus Limnocylindrales bacterium]
MAGPTEQIRTRVVPALLTAFGVTILSAGLLTYSVPVAAEPATPAPDPSIVEAPSPSALLTLPPIGTATETPSASPTPPPPADRVATRVRIKGLGIDLPVVKGNAGYPYCNVAMYLSALSQPGFGKATYLYAHAREGMFLPLLETKARAQRGQIVEVWTSDDMVFRYEIVEVVRHVPYDEGLDRPAAATTEELWLQTSEGPRRPPGQPPGPKTQVLATLVSAKPTGHVASHPKARPVVCG